jgi:hypothetical protein
LVTFKNSGISNLYQVGSVHDPIIPDEYLPNTDRENSGTAFSISGNETIESPFSSCRSINSMAH